MTAPMEVLKKSLAASEKTVAALILQTYNELNEQFTLVESKVKRTQAYQKLIDEYCEEQYRAVDGVDRNSTILKLNVGGKVHIIKRSTMRSEGDPMNFLYLMISGRWDFLLPLPRDRYGVIFIDLDPALMKPILDRLRYRLNYGTNEHMIPRISIDKRANFDKVVLYYRIGDIAPVEFNADDLPINLTSSTKTEQLPLKAVSKPKKVSNIYTNQTDKLLSNLLHMVKVAQLADEKLLLELLWIEHLSVPMSKRNLSTGLLAQWQRICKKSADALPISNGVVVTTCGSETLKIVEESIARLQIKVKPKIRGDSTEDKVKSLTTGKADTAVDDVISFNVGGTIIAVLRSTLLLQAPNSTFAASYSDRWVQQPDELDECGNIYMVKEIIVIAYTLLLLPLYPSEDEDILI